MSKKKHQDSSAEESIENSAVQHAEGDAANGTPMAEGNSLLAEVEQFLQQRQELAQKLAAEIAATERKLADLRKTAAALFPEGDRSARPEKKAKKPRLPKSPNPTEAAPEE